MKIKILALTIVLLSILTLCACGKSNEPPQITAPSGNSGHNHNHNEDDAEKIEYPTPPSYYNRVYSKGYNYITYYTEKYDNPYYTQLFLDGGKLVKSFETKNEVRILEGITNSDAVILGVITEEENDQGHMVTFYDITNDKHSVSRKDFLAASYDFAVFAGDNGFIVRDYFDDSVFCKELPVDASEYDKSKLEYVYAQASPNGKNIVISYTIDGVSYDKPFKLK